MQSGPGTKTSLSILKNQLCSEQGRQWWTADSRLKGGVSIAEDSISGISYFFDLQIMGKEFANFLKLNSLLHWQTENLHQIIWEFNC